MEWRLFVDPSNRSLKAVLLNNGNKFSSIPVGHSVKMKESHESMELLLSALNYQEHKWLICGDLKVVGLVLNFKVVTQSIHALCAYGIVVLMTSIMSDKSKRVAIKTRIKIWVAQRSVPPSGWTEQYIASTPPHQIRHHDKLCKDVVQGR